MNETILLDPETFQKLVDEGEICAWCGTFEQTLGRYCRPSCLVEHRAAQDRVRDAKARLLKHYGSEEAVWKAMGNLFEEDRE